MPDSTLSDSLTSGSQPLGCTAPCSAAPGGAQYSHKLPAYSNANYCSIACSCLIINGKHKVDKKSLRVVGDLFKVEIIERWPRF